MEYRFPETEKESKDVYKAIQDVVEYLTNPKKSGAKGNAFKATGILRESYIIGEYLDMLLWRVFPAKSKTIGEYEESLKNNNVMATSRDVFQSWTKNIKSASEFWEINQSSYFKVNNRNAIPKSLIVEAEMAGKDILLDIRKDFYLYVLEFAMEVEDPKLDRLFSRLKGIHQTDAEQEVFVHLQNKEAVVKKILYLKDHVDLMIS